MNFCIEETFSGTGGIFRGFSLGTVYQILVIYQNHIGTLLLCWAFILHGPHEFPPEEPFPGTGRNISGSLAMLPWWSVH